MQEALGLALVIGGYLTGYIISVYSLAVYIDPDEVENLYPNISKSRRDFLKKLADDPLAFVQTAVIYKSLMLVVLTVSATWLARPWADSTYGWMISSMALVIVWIGYIVFVEYLPRRTSRTAINLHMAKRLWLVSIIYYLLSPAVNLYRRALSRPTGTAVTEEEKEEIVERAIETLAEQAGIGETIVEEDEKEMIGQIFLLDQTVVKEIMIPRMDIVGIERAMDFKQIREVVIKNGHSRYPVYDNTIDKVNGLLYVKDLFNKAPEPGVKFRIDDYLRQPYIVPETKIIGELLREFKRQRLHIAIVVDEYGGTAGLVTLEDIIEEIFGEIQDEYDKEEAEFVKLPDGRWRVPGSMMVEKLQDQLDTDHDQADYDTVGGLIYDLIGSVPTQNQKIRWNDIEFEVERVEGQRILNVLVRILS